MTFPALRHQGCFDSSAVADVQSVNPIGGTPVALAASGAIDPSTAAYYQITKAGVAAMTLAAPTAGLDDGKCIFIQSNTANAHTVTATGLYNSGSASVNLATFAAFAGANMLLQAFNGKWNVISSVGVTFS